MGVHCTELDRATYDECLPTFHNRGIFLGHLWRTLRKDDLGAELQKQFNTVCVSVSCGEVNWRPPEVVYGINVTALVHQ